MASTKKLPVAFNATRLAAQSSDFLVPFQTEGRTALFGLKSREYHQFGMLVFLGRAITENDLFARLVETGAIFENVDHTLAQLQQYIAKLQTCRIGNIVQLRDQGDEGIELDIVSISPSGFSKRNVPPQ